QNGTWSQSLHHDWEPARSWMVAFGYLTHHIPLKFFTQIGSSHAIRPSTLRRKAAANFKRCGDFPVPQVATVQGHNPRHRFVSRSSSPELTASGGHRIASRSSGSIKLFCSCICAVYGGKDDILINQDIELITRTDLECWLNIQVLADRPLS